MAISRAQLLKELLPGLNALFGMEYAKYGEEHKEIFEYKKGGGYWIWKVQLILQSLRDLDDGDILIYSDSGSSLNLSGEKRFQEYMFLFLGVRVCS